jgi:hypothetical protein
MGSNRGDGIDWNSDGIFSLRFGRCYAADKCVVDSSCELFTEHCRDSDKYLEPLLEAEMASSNDPGRDNNATAPPNFAAG